MSDMVMVSTTAVIRGRGSAPYKSVTQLTAPEREHARAGGMVLIQDNNPHSACSGWKRVVVWNGRYSHREFIPGGIPGTAPGDQKLRAYIVEDSAGNRRVYLSHARTSADAAIIYAGTFGLPVSRIWSHLTAPEQVEVRQSVAAQLADQMERRTQRGNE